MRPDSRLSTHCQIHYEHLICSLSIISGSSTDGEIINNSQYGDFFSCYYDQKPDLMSIMVHLPIYQSTKSCHNRMQIIRREIFFSRVHTLWIPCRLYTGAAYAWGIMVVMEVGLRGYLFQLSKIQISGCFGGYLAGLVPAYTFPHIQIVMCIRYVFP